MRQGVSESNKAFALATAVAWISPSAASPDYDLTRFGNNFSGGNNSQSNFRFQTGVQFRF